MYADDTAQVGGTQPAVMWHVAWWLAACGCLRSGPLQSRPASLAAQVHYAPPHLCWLPQGAVLEPQGVVEIKFRAPELIATMHRIDPVILKLKVREPPRARGERGLDLAAMLLKRGTAVARHCTTGSSGMCGQAGQAIRRSAAGRG